MGLFSSKPKVDPGVDPTLRARITTIPTSFYGGKDPVLYANVETEVAPVALSPKGQELQEKPIAAPVVPPVESAAVAVHTPSGFFVERHKTGLIVLLLFIALLGTALLSWILIFQPNTSVPPGSQVSNTPSPVPTPSPENPSTQPTPITQPTSTSSAVTPTPSTTVRGDDVLPLQFPQILLTDSIDADIDGLTDREEELFGIDPGVWDSDGDGYYDGQEVANLYNPKGFAPVRLIDSGLVLDFVHQQTGYRVYYPKDWEPGVVDTRGTQVLFSAATGDFVEVRMMPKESGESFEQWFARSTKGEQYSRLLATTNRFNVRGFRREDDLVAYIPAEQAVYVLIYHPGIESAIPYRHVMSMMVQSFRPQMTAVDLGDQRRIPGTPTTPSVSPNP